MSTQRFSSHPVFFFLTPLLGLLCVWLGIQNARSRREVGKLTTEVAGLRAAAEAAKADDGSAPADRRRRLAAREAPDVASMPTSGSSSETPSTSSGNPGSKRRVDTEAVAAMTKNPMMQKIMASQASAVLQMTYGRLMDQMQLSGEEREFFQKLLLEKQTSLQNLGMQLMNPGLSDGERESIMTKLTEAWTGAEARIREFLNDEGDYAYYQNYSKQEPERRETGMFAESLTGGDAIDPATSDALADLQSEARKGFPFTVDFYNQENFGKPGALNAESVKTFLEEQTRFQAEVAGKAAELLTPAQLTVYRENQAAVRQMSSMQLNSILQMMGGGR